MTAPTADPPRGFGEALARLRSVQKTSKGAPAYSLLVNRRLGRIFAAAAFVLGRTPNQVTAVSALFTFSGIATIALVDPTWASAVAVTALLVIGYALDAADGQLARLRGGGSAVGEWLDHAVDSAKIATLHLAVLVNWYRFGDHTDVELLVPITFQVVASVTFFVVILNDQLRRAHRGSSEMRLQGEGTSSLLYSLAVVPTDYGLLCLVFVLLAAETLFLWAYTALMFANLAFLGLALVKWYREIRRY
ncbi:MAG TPA: CDP-alcohol phosphatidyltransferase family protein [Microthrixaceae bacterium]|nr:CDP-alcohol phosphatidyltransferase family protein [Microthrixaceae bacterium]